MHADAVRRPDMQQNMRLAARLMGLTDAWITRVHRTGHAEREGAVRHSKLAWRRAVQIHEGATNGASRKAADGSRVITHLSATISTAGAARCGPGRQSCRSRAGSARKSAAVVVRARGCKRDQLIRRRLAHPGQTAGSHSASSQPVRRFSGLDVHVAPFPKWQPLNEMVTATTSGCSRRASTPRH